MEQPVLPLTDGSDMIALLREQLQALEAAQGGSQDPHARAALVRLEAALQQLQQAQQHWQEAAPVVAPDTLAPTNQAQLAQDVSRCVNPLAGRLIAASRARRAKPYLARALQAGGPPRRARGPSAGPRPGSATAGSA